MCFRTFSFDRNFVPTPLVALPTTCSSFSDCSALLFTSRVQLGASAGAGAPCIIVKTLVAESPLFLIKLHANSRSTSRATFSTWC